MLPISQQNWKEKRVYIGKSKVKDKNNKYHSMPVDIDIHESLSCIQLLAILWPVAYQAPLSMGFSRQEYWSGLPFPSPGDLPDPGIEPRYPTL